SFQAEDGIRDFHVTGVQTCALPISGGSFPADTLRAVLSYPAGPIPTKWDHLLGPGAASSRKQITPKRATTSASWPSSFPIEYRIAAVGIFAVHTPAFKR